MKKYLLVLAATLIFLLGVNSVGLAEICYVDSVYGIAPGFDVPDGWGHSWDESFKTIKQALEKCISAEEIWVREGSYEVSEGPLLVEKAVKIYGGFPPRDVNVNPNMEDRDWETYETTIEPLYRHNPPAHLMWIRLRSATIDGFNFNRGGNFFNDGGAILIQGCNPTIENCVFNANKAIAGGAIAIFNSSPNIKQCIFKNNRADYGGAIYNSNSKPLISSCLFQNNSAWFYGGAISNSEVKNDSSEIRCENSTFNANEAVNGSGGAIFEGTENDEDQNIPGGTYKNSEFLDNSAKEDGGAIRSVGTRYINIEECRFIRNESKRGGAIFAYDNTTIMPPPLPLEEHDQITGCVFYQNKAYNEGGAIVESGRIEITECRFTLNMVGGDGNLGSGGAISFERPSYLDPGSYAVRNCIFNRNRADYGGAIYNKGVTTEILSCQFNANSASLRGGAIHCESSENIGNGPDLLNCTFYANNSEEDGGAIFIDSVNINIIHNTFYRNQCNFYGGAIRNINTNNDSHSHFIIANSILWENITNIGWPDKEISTEAELVFYEYIVANDIDQAGYDGINSNIRQDPLFADQVHLQTSSPCINSGLNELEYGDLPERDFEGDPRKIDTAPDMGADELLLKVPIDIIPGTCPNTYNYDEPANLTIAILGTNKFNVNSINRNSIKLSFEDIIITDSVTNIRVKNVGRTRYPIGECDCIRGRDRLNDLIFEVVPNKIKGSLPDISEGSELVLTISGLLTDGTHFTGTDCIIISKGTL
ncbi:hypothetical protein ACFL2S_11835 [Thermodesulfobacteriota bacterium]